MLGPRQRRWSALLEGLPDRLTTVHRWTGWRDPDVTAVGHLHHVPTLVACLEGVVRVERPGERLDLVPGALLVIAPGVWHRHHRPRGPSVAWMQGFMSGFSDVLCWDAEASWAGALPSQPSLTLVTRILATAGLVAALDLLRQVLHEDIVERPGTGGAAADRMLRAFWSGLHRGVSAGDLVRVSGLARSRAWQVFTDTYGKPPHRALLEARASLAQGLLDAGMPPGQAARKAGFSAATFARERRKAALLAPRKQRRP